MSRAVWWVLTLVWMGGIWWLSDQPDVSSGLRQDFILRKLGHVFEFAVLTWLLLRAATTAQLAARMKGLLDTWRSHHDVHQTSPAAARAYPALFGAGIDGSPGLFQSVVPARRTTALLVGIVGVALLYALTDEWHQTWVAGREGNLRDVAIDSVGIVLAALFVARRHTAMHREAEQPT